jgi:hypothetical protein
MIEQPDWADALFVFNDNEEQFRAYRRDPADPRGCTRGGGNAAIRPYRCTEPPRAAGIPTGVGGAMEQCRVDGQPCTDQDSHIHEPVEPFARCPRCTSPCPELHPAVQADGEVHVCPDPFQPPG